MMKLKHYKSRILSIAIAAIALFSASAVAASPSGAPERTPNSGTHYLKIGKARCHNCIIFDDSNRSYKQKDIENVG